MMQSEDMKRLILLAFDAPSAPASLFVWRGILFRFCFSPFTCLFVPCRKGETRCRLFLPSWRFFSEYRIDCSGKATGTSFAYKIINIPAAKLSGMAPVFSSETAMESNGMEAHMKRLVSILMESPLYMMLSLQERLLLLKYLAEKYGKAFPL